jgi:deazaflavin-dependent oxidoreductase (nitroreductase family)
MPITGPAASLPKYLNPILRPVARWLPPLALVHHEGRRTHIAYTTPVQAFRTDHGYIVALAYDRNAAWARNLLAANGGQMTRAGERYQLTNPHRSGAEALQQLPRPVAKLMRVLDITDFIEFDAGQTAGR